MSLELTFKNKQSGEELEGDVELTDSIDSILNELKSNKIIPSELYSVKKESDQSSIATSTSFEELGLKDGDKLIFEKRMKRPPSPRAFHQLGIFVLDGSYSMNEAAQGNISKKDAVNNAVSELLTRFKTSKKPNSFSFATVFFGTESSIKFDATALTAIDENQDFDPTSDHNDGTRIHKGLEKAKTIAQSFVSENEGETVPRSVVILVLSDGECSEPDITKKVANEIKELSKIKICTTFLGAQENQDPNAIELLKEVATNKDTDYEDTYDVASLRSFFESSLSKIA